MYEIVYLESSKIDFQEIYSYIWNDNQYSVKVIVKIKNTILYLEDLPYMGQEVGFWLRHLIEQKYKYKILYRIKWNTVEIVHIWKNKNIY